MQQTSQLEKQIVSAREAERFDYVSKDFCHIGRMEKAGEAAKLVSFGFC